MLTLADTWGRHDVGTGWSILMIVFWSMVAVGIAWLAWRGSFNWGSRQPESPREILERRLAAGEISSDEYRELRAVLEDERDASAHRPATPA